METTMTEATTSETAETYSGLRASYDPADNKCRIRSASRLPKELYLRVRAAGFIWAPKQELFVAPSWSPSREDLMIELCGEIEDEDTSLVDRAEQRAERFEDYKERRAEGADRAHAAVSKIADGIPLGQPILLGHHSEKHARRDAEKIENGMRRAVKMWETSEYWKRRAEGALRHAKYLERPEVRARRIKTIEAALRSEIAAYTPRDGHVIMQNRWNWEPSREGLTVEEKDAERDAARIPHRWCGPAGRGGRWVAEEDLPKLAKRAERWIAHYENRLIYERAMLEEAGGLKADKFDIEIGGRVRRRGEWFVVTGLNRKDGALRSVSVIGHWASTMPIEDIQEYSAPKEGDTAKVKAAMKKPPLVNFRAEGCREMTTEEWKSKTRFSDSYWVATFNAERKYIHRGIPLYRQRTAPPPHDCKVYDRIPVFLTDAKVVEPPPIVATPEKIVLSAPPPREVQEPYTPPAPEPDAAKFEGLRESLRAGVKVVSAPQLFPTPMDLARRMVQLADVQPGETVLEPSAGTGNIVRAVIEHADTEIVGYEINRALVSQLDRTFPSYKLKSFCQDFLEVTEGQGQFPVVLMNPPFADGSDITHILHALKFLRPGGDRFGNRAGRLVAICADGPRQNAKLKPLIESMGGTWEPLPRGTFESAGTQVNTVLLSVTADA